VRYTPLLVLGENSQPEHPTRKLVHVVLLVAIADEATEIRFEPQQDVYKLSYRVGGMLHEMVAPPHFLVRRIANIFKVLAGLDILKSQVRQEGRMQVRVGAGSVDIWVALQPTPFGEQIVLTLENSTVTPEQIGPVFRAYGISQDGNCCIDFIEE
jgi:type IV pilus assembly protein PilB